MYLSKKALSLKPSPTLEISAKAAQLKAEGLEVIGLGVGEPDFNTPEFIIQAAKKAIIHKMNRDHQLQYTEKEVVVATGAKFALYLLFQVLLDQDDEVIIPTPYWVSYPDQVELAGGKPVWVEGLEANDFKITAAQ